MQVSFPESGGSRFDENPAKIFEMIEERLYRPALVLGVGTHLFGLVGHG